MGLILSLDNSIHSFNTGKFVLDQYTGAAAGYSLRRLSVNTTNVVRVRRSSDNAEADFTAAEVADGTLENWVNTDVLKYESDFTSGNSDLSEVNGIGTDGETIDGVSDAYKFTLSGGSVNHFTRVLGKINATNTFNISFDFYIPSSNSAVDGIQMYLLSGAPVYNTLDSWTSVTLTNVTSSSDQLRFYAVDGTNLTIDADGDVFYLKNIVVTQTTADGHVTTWYDQAGSNDATQATAAEQPKIVDAGVLVEENGKPAVQFDGTHLMEVFSPDVRVGGYLELAVAASNSTTPSTFAGLISHAGTLVQSVQGYLGVRSSGTSWGTFDATNRVFGSTTGSQQIIHRYNDGTNNIQTNKVDNIVGDVYNTTNAIRIGIIGHFTSTSGQYIGTAQEILLWGNQDGSLIESGVYNNVSSYY